MASVAPVPSVDPPLPADKRLGLVEARLADLEVEFAKATKLQSAANPGKDVKESDLNSSDSGSSAATKCNEETRVKIVVNKLDPSSTSDTKRDFDDSNDVETKQPTSVAILLRKFVDSERDETECESEIEILGEELRNLLKQLLQHYPYHLLGNTVVIPSPFECIVLNWDLLTEESKANPFDEKDRLARIDLRVLLDTISQKSGDERLQSYFKLRQSLVDTSSITFENLWTIFPPGALVYSRPFLKQDQVFIVQDNTGPWPVYEGKARRYAQWHLSCWTYDWGGQTFERRLLKLSIPFFDGQRPISSLSVHPLEFNGESKTVKERLLERGKLFRKYCTIPKQERMFRYTGSCILDSGLTTSTLDLLDAIVERHLKPRQSSLAYGAQRSEHEESTDPQAQSKHPMVSSNIMVDFESYYKYGPSTGNIGDRPLSDDNGEICECQECMTDTRSKLYRRDYDGKKGHPDEKWTDEQLILCPPRVLGYVLREKKWAQLDVNKIVSLPEKDDAFWSKLRLAGGDGGLETKKMLHGLVKNHGISEVGNSGKSGYEVEDIVAEKGKGLVILLYGPPGVGKTSTAQTIAVAANKPLFPVGVADIGMKPVDVEERLAKIFDLATRWQAVLLIDEADVFLQSRARGQMGPTTERNALVSVFLQVLEYFQGILILTTNQISQFDVAVQSRIHIALHFENLDKQQTSEIFCGFLNQYEKRGLVAKDMYDGITKYVEKELYRERFDGRQIRNVVTCAMGLACSERRRLTLEDVQTVVRYTKIFKADLEYQMRKYQENESGGNQ